MLKIRLIRNLVQLVDENDNHTFILDILFSSLKIFYRLNDSNWILEILLNINSLIHLDFRS